MTARALFFGTAPCAVPALRALVDDERFDLIAAVSQPASARGRGRKMQPSAVAQAARELGLPVETPNNLRDGSGHRLLDHYRPDLCLVIAYGQIIASDLLDRLPQRWFNLHGSLLPRWRGAAPIERAIEAGDSETGMQLMAMEASLDTGPVYASRSVTIGEHTTTSLTHALAGLGADLVTGALYEAFDGNLRPTQQATAGVTYAHCLTAAEGTIDFLGDAQVWANRCRAFDPRPGLRCSVVRSTTDNPEAIKIWAAHVAGGDLPSGAPGQIVEIRKKVIVVACERGHLAISELQQCSKRRMPWSAMRQGFPLAVGDRLIR
jgi:methionyl-tRNA formyltransferase